MFVVDSELQIPFSELTFTFVRSSGPGGQNVNKVSSRAQLSWAGRKHLGEEVWARLERCHPSRVTVAGEIIISSQRTRDQLKNKEDCLEKLRNLLIEIRQTPRKRHPTRPTRGSMERRLRDKRRRSETRQMRSSRYEE